MWHLKDQLLYFNESGYLFQNCNTAFPQTVDLQETNMSESQFQVYSFYLIVYNTETLAFSCPEDPSSDSQPGCGEQREFYVTITLELLFLDVW